MWLASKKDGIFYFSSPISSAGSFIQRLAGRITGDYPGKSDRKSQSVYPVYSTERYLLGKILLTPNSTPRDIHFLTRTLLVIPFTSQYSILMLLNLEPGSRLEA